jgi:hypothetical protein
MTLHQKIDIVHFSSEFIQRLPVYDQEGVRQP